MNSKSLATISTIALLLSSSAPTASAVSLTTDSQLIQAPAEAPAKTTAAAGAATASTAAAGANQPEQRRDKTEKPADRAPEKKSGDK
jgi:hypothetical protein